MVKWRLKWFLILHFREVPIGSQEKRMGGVETDFIAAANIH